MSLRLPRSVSLWLPVLLWAALIFSLSAVPSLDSGLGTWDLVVRKIGHAGEFAVLALLFLRALGVSPWRYGLAFAAACAYAASDELHQHFVRGRTGSPRDVAIDAAGTALGLIAAAVWLRFRLSGRRGRPGIARTARQRRSVRKRRGSRP